MTEFGIVQDERLLKASDIARILNVSKAFAYRLIQQDEIPVVQINHAVRVKPSDLEVFIQRCRKDLNG